MCAYKERQEEDESLTKALPVKVEKLFQYIKHRRHLRKDQTSMLPAT